MTQVQKCKGAMISNDVMLVSSFIKMCPDFKFLGVKLRTHELLGYADDVN
jgi:hypothetical protein